MEEGIEVGEVCNRNGCKLLIQEKDTDECCSCHINPPCSYCVTDRTFCECGYDGEEEQNRVFNNLPVQKAWESYRVRTIKDLDRTKIDYLSLGHTHFSMKKVGVYPKEWDSRKAMIEIRPKVKGTFGGRFTKCRGGEFIYIAYTD